MVDKDSVHLLKRDRRVQLTNELSETEITAVETAAMTERRDVAAIDPLDD